MSDILSGGVIDNSTDGPIPPNVDDRNRDIIAEQKEVQRQDAIGGTAEPPRTKPPEQIPEPTQVAPPLPFIPSFDFGISGSLAEETREVARQATIDVIKNVTINGQGPSIEGSTISFYVPQQPPASEAFIFQGVAIPQPQFSLTPQVAMPQLPIELQRPAMLVPSSQVETPQEVRVESEKITDVSVFAPQGKTSEQEPVIQEGLSIKEQRIKEAEIREQRDIKIRTSIGLDAVSPLDVPSEPVIPRGEPIGRQQEAENADREQKDRDTRRGIGLDAESSMDEESESAKAYKAAEARRDERREGDFDRESSIRQRGESPTEFRERQEQLKEERERRAQEEENKSNFLKQAESGIIKEVPSGMIPVRLTRADGQKKVLAIMASEFVGVVDGATSGDRTATLPSEDSYYEAGGNVPPHPWQVTLRTENGVTQYKVDFNSTLYSGLGSFNNIEVTGLDFWATASVGYLYLFGVVENGICTDASIQGPEETPSDRVDFVGVEQNSFSVLIAYLYDDGNGGIAVQQRAFHDFTIINACINGRPSIYPIAT